MNPKDQFLKRLIQYSKDYLNLVSPSYKRGVNDITSNLIPEQLDYREFIHNIEAYDDENGYEISLYHLYNNNPASFNSKSIDLVNCKTKLFEAP